VLLWQLREPDKEVDPGKQKEVVAKDLHLKPSDAMAMLRPFHLIISLHL